MSQRRPRSRALRPMSEALETRQLLTSTGTGSRSITGIDADGDRWVLKVQGPGAIRVTKQPDAQGNFQELNSRSLIDNITIAGADPFSTRIIGQVKQVQGGDGKVFFSSFQELGGNAEGSAGNLGIYAIDMPDFWLGQTSTTVGASGPSIDIPDGVVTLRFGGADTTFTPAGGTPLNQNNQADSLTVNLGLPQTQGTSIIINRSITDAQAATTTTGSPTQDSVTFTVNGRLNVFQADSIEGNTQFPSTGFLGGGGTVVNSTTDPSSGITGQIGFVRVGGNATNFAAQVGGTTALLSNFFVGGETNNVLVLAPAGTRAIGFGKGMDTVTIYTHYIDSLQANRGALSSLVQVDRNVGRVTIGGDVVNTQFIAGVDQSLTSVSSTQTAPTSPVAQDGGAIRNVLIAGNVTDSVFAASVEPFNGVYGSDLDLNLPHGNIAAKVGGKIDNTNATVGPINQAFFANYVKLFRGPVIPPAVPELPFRNQGAAPSGSHVVPGLQPTTGQRTNLLREANAAQRAANRASLNGARAAIRAAEAKARHKSS